MKQTSTFIFFTAVCLSLHAQISIEQFPVENYLFPDIDRKTLGIDLDLSGSYGRTVGTVFDFQNTIISSQYISSNWSRFVNTRAMQVFQSGFLGLTGFFNWNGDQVDDGRSRFTIEPIGSFSMTKRNYDQNRFLEWGGEVLFNYGYQRDRRDDSPLDINKNSSYALDLSLDFKKGRGRLEPVDDLILALYCLEDLRDSGLLTASDLDSLAITGFADEMAIVRNDRVFDARRLRIHQLMRLYEYMDEQRWITDHSNPVYFAILNDNWQYAFRNVRQSGKRRSFGLTPSYYGGLGKNTRIQSSSESFAKIDVYSWGIQAILDVDKERVMSLYKQRKRSHEVRLGYGRERSKIESSGSFSDEYSTQAMALTTLNSISWGFYPNSRTSLVYGLQADLAIGWDFDSSLLGSVRGGVFLNSSYFLSYRTRLNFDVSAFYRGVESELPISLDVFEFEPFSDASLQLKLRLTLTHDIF